MRYVAECRYAEVNDKPASQPIYTPLSGGAGVGKSFLINGITEYGTMV